MCVDQRRFHFHPQAANLSHATPFEFINNSPEPAVAYPRALYLVSEQMCPGDGRRFISL